MGLAVFSVITILLPEIAREEAAGKVNPPTSHPFLYVIGLMSIPIFVALYQTLKLLKYIDENKAFSQQSVTALRNIKYCAITFSILFALGAISVIVIARLADPTEEVAPIVTLGFLFTFTSSIIATFTAVLQKLLQNAIDMKSENELTV